jgi:RNase adaptor protein for sRNA GlmZ degradation
MDSEKSKGELQRDYFAAVNGIVEDVREAIPAGDLPEDEWSDRVQEAIDEAVDSSEWVIYTWRNMEVLRISQHDDAYLELGIDALDFKHGIPWNQLAYAAMLEDVTEAYHRHPSH